MVDGGGSLRCALVGGMLAQLGETNGWAGIVVYGCVRDREEIAAAKVGVKALASHPRRSRSLRGVRVRRWVQAEKRCGARAGGRAGGAQGALGRAVGGAEAGERSRARRGGWCAPQP